MPATASGVIEPEKLYHIEAAKRETGWGARSLREARRKGLPVLYLGRRAFVLGRDIIEHIQKHGTPTKAGT